MAENGAMAGAACRGRRWSTTPRPTTSHRDIYQEVTDRVAASLEAGVVPWVRPWHLSKSEGLPRNGATQRHYSGVNVFLLWMTAGAFGYGSQEWFTFQQLKKLDASVRKGEKGTQIVFWAKRRVKDKGSDDPKARKDILLIKFFYVFNREQTTLPPREVEPLADQLSPAERLARAEDFILGTGADFRESAHGNRAYYRPADDFIEVPPFGRFRSAPAYYSTAFHELGHWTGAESRLDRLSAAVFGSEDYAKEELVAEMASAFLCAIIGIEGQLQHPEYVASWLQKLKGDKKFLFSAASQARQAADYLIVHNSSMIGTESSILPGAGPDDDEDELLEVEE
jgi:antirestriction protein ArdC